MNTNYTEVNFALKYIWTCIDLLVCSCLVVIAFISPEIIKQVLVICIYSATPTTISISHDASQLILLN